MLNVPPCFSLFSVSPQRSGTCIHPVCFSLDFPLKFSTFCPRHPVMRSDDFRKRPRTAFHHEQDLPRRRMRKQSCFLKRQFRLTHKRKSIVYDLISDFITSIRNQGLKSNGRFPQIMQGCCRENSRCTVFWCQLFFQHPAYTHRKPQMI